jgi:hypothetical protein
VLRDLCGENHCSLGLAWGCGSSGPRCIPRATLLERSTKTRRARKIRLFQTTDIHYDMTAGRASDLTRYQIKNSKKEVLTRLG